MSSAGKGISGSGQKQQSGKKTATKLPQGGLAGADRSAAKRGRRRRGETFHLYINKVLKQVQPRMGLGKKSTAIMNSLINDVFDRLTTEAIRLIFYNKKRTLSSREIQTAVKLLIPGELAKHAAAEGVKAVDKYEGKAL